MRLLLHTAPVGTIHSVPLMRSSVLQGQSTGHVRIALRGAILIQLKRLFRKIWGLRTAWAKSPRCPPSNSVDAGAAGDQHYRLYLDLRARALTAYHDHICQEKEMKQLEALTSARAVEPGPAGFPLPLASCRKCLESRRSVAVHRRAAPDQNAPHQRLGGSPSRAGPLPAGGCRKRVEGW
jgi:hypothetical protein